MNEREAFIEAWRSQRFDFSELCRRFGVSRPTGYKWTRRFEERGMSGLAERSRAPQSHPNRTPEHLIAKLLEAKQQLPDWGPVPLIGMLRSREPHEPWPAASTAGDILKRHGLVKPRQCRRRTPPHTEPLRHATAPNALWSADFKGDFALGHGSRCYPLTISDNYSRFVIECKALPSIASDPVKQRYTRAFCEYGLPEAIRTDNGYPFAGPSIGGLSDLSIWLLKLDVLPERIAPGHPEQNPRHERMHRTLKAAAINPPKANRSAQQRAFNVFRYRFNELRPHRALDGNVPAAWYRPSPRPFPSTLPPVEYPDDYVVRRVRQSGEFRWRGRVVYICQRLAGEPIGLRPLGNDCWQLYFARLALGIFDERSAAIVRPDTPPRRHKV